MNIFDSYRKAWKLGEEFDFDVRYKTMKAMVEDDLLHYDLEDEE